MTYSCYISQAVDVVPTKYNTLKLTFWVEVTHVEDTCATQRIVPVPFSAISAEVMTWDDASLSTWFADRQHTITFMAIKAFNEALEKAKK